MDKNQSQSFLSRQGLRPLKSLGQNFLAHPGFAQSIAEKARALPPPYVEIGPGLGALTRFFAGRKQDILLVEKDKKLASYWKREGWQVLCADILKLDPGKLPQKFSLFGNLPYEIFGSLILRSTLMQNRVKGMLFMGQREPARRVTAGPGVRDYGFLSVASQAFWNIAPVLDVPAQAFYPRPKVSGRVLEFRPKACFQGEQGLSALPEPEPFLRFLRLCFRFKRKKLMRQLPAPSPQAAEQALKSLNLNPKARPEELSVAQFLRLYFLLSFYLEKNPSGP